MKKSCNCTDKLIKMGNGGKVKRAKAKRITMEEAQLPPVWQGDDMTPVNIHLGNGYFINKIPLNTSPDIPHYKKGGVLKFPNGGGIHPPMIGTPSQVQMYNDSLSAYNAGNINRQILLNNGLTEIGQSNGYKIPLPPFGGLKFIDPYLPGYQKDNGYMFQINVPTTKYDAFTGKYLKDWSLSRIKGQEYPDQSKDYGNGDYYENLPIGYDVFREPDAISQYSSGYIHKTRNSGNDNGHWWDTGWKTVQDTRQINDHTYFKDEGVSIPMYKKPVQPYYSTLDGKNIIPNTPIVYKTPFKISPIKINSQNLIPQQPMTPQKINTLPAPAKISNSNKNFTIHYGGNSGKGQYMSYPDYQSYQNAINYLKSLGHNQGQSGYSGNANNPKTAYTTFNVTPQEIVDSLDKHKQGGMVNKYPDGGSIEEAIKKAQNAEKYWENNPDDRGQWGNYPSVLTFNPLNAKYNRIDNSIDFPQNPYAINPRTLEPLGSYGSYKGNPNVTDPQLLKSELGEYKSGGWIQGAIKHPGRCTPGSPNYDCPKGSPQWNLAQRFKHGDLHKHEDGGIANILGAVGSGSKIGSLLGPEGSIVGAIAGGVLGVGSSLVNAAEAAAENRRQSKIDNQMIKSQYANNYNINPYGYGDGGEINQSMIDIEKGELRVNKDNRGQSVILQEYNNPNIYKPHSKNQNDENPGNFVKANNGDVIISKDKVNLYKQMDNIGRSSIERALIKRQIKNHPEQLGLDNIIQKSKKGGMVVRKKYDDGGGYIDDWNQFQNNILGTNLPSSKLKLPMSIKTDLSRNIDEEKNMIVSGVNKQKDLTPEQYGINTNDIFHPYTNDIGNKNYTTTEDANNLSNGVNNKKGFDYDKLGLVASEVGPIAQLFKNSVKDPIKKEYNMGYNTAKNYINQLPIEENVDAQLNGINRVYEAGRRTVLNNSNPALNSARQSQLTASQANDINNIYGQKFKDELGLKSAKMNALADLDYRQGANTQQVLQQYDNDILKQSATQRLLQNSAITNIGDNIQKYSRDKQVENIDYFDYYKWDANKNNWVLKDKKYQFQLPLTLTDDQIKGK